MYYINVSKHNLFLLRTRNLAETAALEVYVMCPLTLLRGVGIAKFALTIVVVFLVVVLPDQKE
jgi:hypothetical protein